jgi:hypothetical protein
MQVTLAGLRSPTGSDDGIRRLSAGLIGYGVAGLVLALAGVVAFAWIGGRVSSVADSVDADVRQLTTALDRSADALHDAGDSAVSFSTTLERTPPSVRQSADTIRNLRPNLLEIEAQLASINILGTEPLAVPARLFGDMARDLEGLDTRLDTIADDLTRDRTALGANAGSLRAAGDEAARLAERLRAGTIQDDLGDLRAVLLVLTLLFVASMAVPAIGALMLGFWLRQRMATGAVLSDAPGL